MVGDDEASQVQLSGFLADTQFYPLVSNAPKHIREASYELLVSYIRRTKEQIEIEAALAPTGDLSNIRGLPEELLSIIVDTDFLHESEAPGAEISRRRLLEGYLMSWSLIFQHFIDSVILQKERADE